MSENKHYMSQIMPITPVSFLRGPWNLRSFASSSGRLNRPASIELRGQYKYHYNLKEAHLPILRVMLAKMGVIAK